MFEMRIVFSRKGFDSGAGGCASAIVEGRPISLPIPTNMPSQITYRELADPIGELVKDLSRGRVDLDQKCHLDPDLDWHLIDRRPGWRGSLGQVGAAQGHLSNQGIREGDLFLFWGLFRPVCRSSRWEYSGPAEHRIYGWLQVGEILSVGSEPEPYLLRYPWLFGHPHMSDGWNQNNTVYVARRRLSLGSMEVDMPGWGLFARGSRLTGVDSSSPSVWEMPDWLNPNKGGVGLTYNPEHRWLQDGRLRSAARGQEFVADVSKRNDASEWLAELFREVL